MNLFIFTNALKTAQTSRGQATYIFNIFGLRHTNQMQLAVGYDKKSSPPLKHQKRNAHVSTIFSYQHAKYTRFLVGNKFSGFKGLFYKGLRTARKQGQMKDVLQIIGSIEKPKMNRDFNFYVDLLKDVVKKDSDKGRCLHGSIIKAGVESDIMIGNAIIHMYVIFDGLEDSCKVFDKMPQWNVVSWTSLISGHVKHGLDKEALDIFSQMQQSGFEPNQFTCVCVSMACARLGWLESGKQVHAYAVTTGALCDVFVGTAFVDMYAKCGFLEHARQVFDKMPLRNVVTWNAMMGAYVQSGQEIKALNLCRGMLREGKKDRMLQIQLEGEIYSRQY